MPPFIPIGSRLSTETRFCDYYAMLRVGFIPIGSRLSTETRVEADIAAVTVELHPHRLAVEH